MTVLCYKTSYLLKKHTVQQRCPISPGTFVVFICLGLRMLIQKGLLGL